MDDALDYVADQKEFGKERGHDLFEGKMTLPLIHTYHSASARECAQISRIVEAEDLVVEDLDYVCKLIEEKGGITYTRGKALERIARAKSLLEIFPDSAARQALFELADYVVSRTK
jgi:octaprenyl-diphosphate synthase